MSKDQTKEIANKLVAYCKEDNSNACLGEFYSEGAISVEADVMPGKESAETKGIDGIRAKHEWWETNFELHSSTTEGPFLRGFLFLVNLLWWH